MPDTPKEEMVALIRRLRDDENAARRHQRIEYDSGSFSLADLFDESRPGNQDLAEMLSHLQNRKSVRSSTEGRPLVVAGNPDQSLLVSIITPDSGDEIRSMSRKFDDADRAVVRRWIESLPVREPEPIPLPELNLKTPVDGSREEKLND